MRRETLTAISFLILSLPAFSQSGDEAAQCPVLIVTGPASVTMPDEPWKFSAKIGEDFDDSKLEFVWKTEGGKITGGQGTKSIEAVLDKCGHLLKATLEIKGLPAACPNVISETGVISHNCELMQPFAVDAYGKVKFEEVENKIENLLKKLEEYPAAEAVFEIQKNADAVDHIKRIDKYLTAKKFDKRSISYVISDSGKRETWLWLMPSGAELPDCYSCEIIKAEDKKKLNELFQSKTNK